MLVKTLDEYLKQTTYTTTRQQLANPKYRITVLYKETEFQETPIGKIPKEWKIMKLYEITEKIRAGGTPRVSRREYWNGSIPFVKIEDLTTSRKYLCCTKTFITELGLKNSNAWIVPEESLLLAMYGSMGEVAINKIKVATNQAILGIIPKPDSTTVEYLYYWFLYFKPKWQIYAKWTTQPNLTAQIVKNSYVPLPPLEEQWGIAEVLSTVDRAIEETEELIKKLESLKQALMQELLTKGIGHKEYKKSPIGKIPKGWKVVRLGEIVDIFDSMRVPLSERERANMKGSYPYCGANGIIDYIDDYIFDGEYVLLAEDGGYYGPFEKSAYIMNGKFWVNNHAHVLKAKEGIALNKFLMYMLNFLDLRPYLVGSTRAKLNQKEMKNTRLPLPPLEEQKHIVTSLSSIDEWIELEKKRKEKFERLKCGLMELLLTGKVRVKVERVG